MVKDIFITYNNEHSESGAVVDKSKAEFEYICRRANIPGTPGYICPIKNPRLFREMKEREGKIVNLREGKLENKL